MVAAGIAGRGRCWLLALFPALEPGVNVFSSIHFVSSIDLYASRQSLLHEGLEVRFSIDRHLSHTVCRYNDYSDWGKL